MVRSVAKKAMWVGRATMFMVGLAVTLALVLGVSTTALASIPGDPFRLGQTNGIDTMSTLVGNVAGTMLRVDNNSTEKGATALDLRVESGKAPMKVNSGAKVALLNADKVDGKDATAFYAAGSKVEDSSHADTADAAAKAREADHAATADLATTADSAKDAELLDGKSATDFAAAYKRTVVVSPTGTDTENGTALLNALNGITDASATKPYLIYIEPGTYDLGSGSLQMKEYVDIQGAGELNTIITSSVTNCSCGTVGGVDNAELRFLTVRNTGTGDSIAIYNSDASPRLTNVSALATGVGGTTHIGVDNERNSRGSSPTMTNVAATASGADSNQGVTNRDSSPTMINVAATASGGTMTTGVYIIGHGSSPTMTNVTATASGGSIRNVGVFEITSSATIRQSKLSGANYSLLVDGTAKVADTQFVGPVRKLSGTLQCFNNYDQNMAAVTCP